MFKTYSKRQNLVQNKTHVQIFENILKIPFVYLGVFHLDIFRHYETSKIFGLLQNIHFFDILQQERCSNSQMVPLFSAPVRSFGFFGSVSKLFCEFFIKKRPEHIFKSWRFSSLGHSADLGRSRLVKSLKPWPRHRITKSFEIYIFNRNVSCEGATLRLQKIRNRKSGGHDKNKK